MQKVLILSSISSFFALLLCLQDFDQLSAFMKKHFLIDVEEVDLSVKGWNWGVAKFKGK